MARKRNNRYNRYDVYERPTGARNSDVRLSFKSWGEFIDYAVNTPSPTPSAKFSSLRSNLANRLDSWYSPNHSSMSVSQAIGLARNGWGEGAERIKAFSGRLTNNIATSIEREQYYMDVYTPFGTYDMGTAITGNPECAYNVMHVPDTDRMLRVVVPVTISFSNSTTEIVNRGSVVTSFVQLCELAGVRCKVEAVISGTSGVRHEYRTTVKDYSDTLDLPLLAYQLAHPSAFRFFGHLVGELNGMHAGGYSPSFDADERGDVYFPALDIYHSEASSAAHLVRLLKEHGIIAKDK